MSNPTHYAVSAARDGFRRSGRAWSRTPIVVPAAELDDAALAALRADPSITVVPTGPEGPDPEGGPPPLPADVPSARAALLGAAARQLDPDDDTQWNKDGRPDISALEAASGLATVSAVERDAAWEEASAAA